MAKRKLKAMAKKKPKVPMKKKKLKAQTKKKPKAPTKKLKTPAMAVVGVFTVHELSAAKRLVLLSGSNTSSSGGSRSAVFASSVNVPPVTAQAMPRPAEDYLSDEEMEDDSQEVPGIPRRTRLYRFVFEIYQVTQPMKK